MRGIVIGRTRYFICSWEDVEKDTLKLAEKLDHQPTMIVGILRGGFVPAMLLSDFLNVKSVRAIGIRYYREIGKRAARAKIYQRLDGSLEGEDVLLVDDVADSGRSLKVGSQLILAHAPRSLELATLHVKPWTKRRPDYFVRVLDGWIIYPWNKLESAVGLLRKLQEKYSLERSKNMIAKKLRIPSRMAKRAGF